MRNKYFAICLLTLVFASCPEPSDDNTKKPPPGGNPNPDTGTWVLFVNDNKFPVSIYSDRLRQIKIADADAKSRSAEIPAVPNPDGAQFYPVYHIIFDGVSIPYEGYAIISSIEADKTNTVNVHALESLGQSELAKPLSDSAYIKIQNDGSFSLLLRQGSSELNLDGLDSAILNGHETGVYKINHGLAASYSLMKNASIRVEFPPNITEFTAGCLYSFRYDDYNLTLTRKYNLTISEALSD
jgi:hypothetical protein